MTLLTKDQRDKLRQHWDRCLVLSESIVSLFDYADSADERIAELEAERDAWRKACRYIYETAGEVIGEAEAAAERTTGE